MTNEILVTANALKRQIDEMEGILEIVSRWVKAPHMPRFAATANDEEVVVPRFINEILLKVLYENLEKQLQTVQKEFKEL